MTGTVAEQFVEMLVHAGVRRIYGIVGDSLNPVVDAVRRTAGIDWVDVRHEEAAAFAASGEAQLTGQLAMCAGSCGPGNLHLINGLYDAHRSRAPVLALASHITSDQIGTEFFQETHPETVFAECSYFCETITQATQMPRLLRIAMETAVGLRGVSVVVLPGDVAHREAVHPTPTGSPITARASARFDADQLDQLAERLNAAQRVMLFCGAGCRDAHDEVMAVAGRLHAPVGHALGGKEWIQYDNPFDVGMSGLLGYGACYEAMHQADLVVLLGTDFPYDEFLPEVPTVQIDLDATRLGRRTTIELGVQGDVRQTLRAILPQLRQKPDRSFLDTMLRRHARALERVVDAYTQGVDAQVPIHPEYAADTLDQLAAEDAVFTVDTGMCNVWAARYITPTPHRRVLGSFRHGSMANALPQAIGAQLAEPDRQVISLSGDGGLAMLLGELLTLAEHELPVTVVLFNNNALGMIKLEMMVDGLPAYQTDRRPVNYAALATAAGIHAIRVEKPAEVRDALHNGLAHRGPSLVELVTDPNALSIPPHITTAQVKGFALAASRTVLAGGVGTMLKMARSNVRNIPRP